MEHAADAPFERELAAPDGIDGHARGIRRVFHGQPHLQVHGHVAEQLALHADEADLLVVLPRHVIARADVDIPFVKSLRGDGLHRLGL